jgi:DNA-directed RNA polymerase specialized sigma24 family protein
MPDDPRRPTDDDAPDDDDGPLEGDDPSAPPLDPKVVRAFLASKKAHEVTTAAIAKKVPAQEVAELVAEALASALEAPPPRAEAALVAWLRRIARRRAADWLRKRKRRQKYEGAMPVQASPEDAYTGEPLDADADGPVSRAAASYDPESDDGPEDLLGDHLDRLVGANAKDRETLAWIREHGAGKAYKSIAAERGLTEDQIGSRIYRFKQKYEGPVKQRRQRMVLLWLLAAGAAALALAVVLWWLLHREERPGVRVLPAPAVTSILPSLGGGLPVSHPYPGEPDAAPREPDAASRDRDAGP